MMWVLLKDGGPPKGEYVLLLGYFGADIEFRDTAGYHERIAIGCWEEGSWYIPHLHCDVPREVTYWMHLPYEPVVKEYK